MTIVNVDVTDVAGKFGPNDKIIFYSPVYREGESGEIISTAQSVFSLAEGPSTVDLAPGPVRIKFKVQGIADIRDKEGVVPATGPVDLADIIEGSFSYTPPVVGDAQAARDRAIQAASDAEGYTTTASNASNAASDYAQEAKGYRDIASGHAQTATNQADVATDKASEADTSATTAGNHASAADTARQGAVTAQDLAETARDEAVVARDEAEQAATDTASALDARIPADLALRVDTTVGTRVFAGDNMIYGDTGLRDITHLIPEPWRTSASWGYIRRYNGNQVDLILYNLTHAAASSGSTLIIELPEGFGGIRTNAMPRTLFHTSSATTFRSYFSTTKRLNSLPPNPVDGSQCFGSVTYSTNDPWPSSLPGLPA